MNNFAQRVFGLWFFLMVASLGWLLPTKGFNSAFLMLFAISAIFNGSFASTYYYRLHEGLQAFVRGFCLCFWMISLVVFVAAMANTYLYYTLYVGGSIGGGLALLVLIRAGQWLFGYSQSPWLAPGALNGFLLYVPEEAVNPNWKPFLHAGRKIKHVAETISEIYATLDREDLKAIWQAFRSSDNLKSMALMYLPVMVMVISLYVGNGYWLAGDTEKACWWGIPGLAIFLAFAGYFFYNVSGKPTSRQTHEER